MNYQIWLLYLSNKKNLGLIPHNLDYFQNHFVGKSMSHHWRPPPVTVGGKSKRLRDFISWMHHVPVCSTKAKNCLQPILGKNVEFLPLTQIRDKTYYAINILKIVDCLDLRASDILFALEKPNCILNIKTYRFISAKLENVPLFRVPNPTSMAFVTKTFVDVVITHQLTGVNFADPSIDCWNYVLGRKSPNIVPGAID